MRVKVKTFVEQIIKLRRKRCIISFLTIPNAGKAGSKIYKIAIDVAVWIFQSKYNGTVYAGRCCMNMKPSHVIRCDPIELDVHRQLGHGVVQNQGRNTGCQTSSTISLIGLRFIYEGPKEKISIGNARKGSQQQSKKNNNGRLHGYVLRSINNKNV